MSGVSKYEFDHHGPWCQRVGAESLGKPRERAERAKSRSVNMRAIVTQRHTVKWRKKTGKGPQLIARTPTGLSKSPCSTVRCNNFPHYEIESHDSKNCLRYRSEPL